jgi:hypothetical protein
MPTRFRPFPPVDGRYGAPLGRVNTANAFSESAHLCAAGPAGEYDAGGAYWGLSPHEGPVWAVWERGKGRDGVMYVRAWSRQAAIRKAKA